VGAMVGHEGVCFQGESIDQVGGIALKNGG